MRSIWRITLKRHHYAPIAHAPVRLQADYYDSTKLEALQQWVFGTFGHEKVVGPFPDLSLVTRPVFAHGTRHRAPGRHALRQKRLFHLNKPICWLLSSIRRSNRLAR